MENTPLMHSVKNWNIEVIKLILEKLNGDLTIRDKNNLTVLEQARNRNFYSLIEYLEQAKAKRKFKVPKF